MPRLEAFFHYRNLDVSTVKILAHCRLGAGGLSLKGWKGGCLTTASGRTFREAIEELRYYRCFMGALAGKLAFFASMRQVSTTVSGFSDIDSMP